MIKVFDWLTMLRSWIKNVLSAHEVSYSFDFGFQIHITNKTA